MLGGSCGFDTNQLIATAHQWAKSMPSIIIIIGNVYWTNYCEWWKAAGWWVLLHTVWKLRKNTHLTLTLLWQKLSWKQRFSYWRNTWKKIVFTKCFLGESEFFVFPHCALQLRWRLHLPHENGVDGGSNMIWLLVVLAATWWRPLFTFDNNTFLPMIANKKISCLFTFYEMSKVWVGLLLLYAGCCPIFLLNNVILTSLFPNCLAKYVTALTLYY